MNSGLVRGFGNSFPATPALVKLDSIKLPHDASELRFRQISQEFSHLLVYFITRGDIAFTFCDMYLQFNGDTGSNYDNGDLFGSNGGASGGAQVAQTQIVIAQTPSNNSTAGWASTVIIEIPFYNQTDWKKTAVASNYLNRDQGAGGQFDMRRAGSWRNTDAIRDVRLFPQSSGNWKAGSHGILYGIH